MLGHTRFHQYITARHPFSSLTLNQFLNEIVSTTKLTNGDDIHELNRKSSPDPGYNPPMLHDAHHSTYLLYQ